MLWIGGAAATGHAVAVVGGRRLDVEAAAVEELWRRAAGVPDPVWRVLWCDDGAEQWRLAVRVDDPPSVRLKVFIGLVIGTAVSAVAWLLLWNHLNLALLVGVVVAKVVVGLVLARNPTWRPFAQGLLVSLGTGTLIFLGKCATSMNEL
jgi:hypothetical protein